jgi:hypothetical protein
MSFVHTLLLNGTSPSFVEIRYSPLSTFDQGQNLASQTAFKPQKGKNISIEIDADVEATIELP